MTDLAPPTGVSVSRPVLAVKIDDAIPSADPQTGLNQADIVYDEPVEGGLDYFLALYQCGDPTRVGPVREAEWEDPDILTQFGTAIFGNAGGPAAVNDRIAGTVGIVNANANKIGPAYSRDPSRQAPYNLMANAALLRGIKAPVTGSALAAPPPQFGFRPATPTGTASDDSSGSSSPGSGTSPTPSPRPAGKSLSFLLGPRVSYDYDAQTNAYLRSENGHAMVDDTGAQIAVTNVVILWTQIGASQVVDGAGNAEPAPTFIGTGNALVMSGGVEYDGTWTRATPTAPVSFFDAGGHPLAMTPGNTWIHVLNADEQASVQ